MSLSPAVSETPRERIVAATTKLLDEGGHTAVSTRAVSAAAGVQAPTIYRLFGDKQGLLDAVAVAGFMTYLETKAGWIATEDPVEDLRTGWDLHVAFGIANPAVFSLMYAARQAGDAPPAAVAAFSILGERVRSIAEAGRLRVAEELAAQLVHAAGTGTTLHLIATPEEQRDPGLSDLARDAVIAAITTDDSVLSEPGPVGAAIALRATLAHTTALTRTERDLLDEWLVRITNVQTDAR